MEFSSLAFFLRRRSLEKEHFGEHFVRVWEETVKYKRLIEWVADKGAVERGVKSSLEKARKPGIKGKKGARTVN